MIYKRATRAVEEANINHIQIVKYLWGPAPEDTRAMKQTSRCFDTWQAARDAVLEGYRPQVDKWKEETACYYAGSPNCFGDVYLCAVCNSWFCCGHHWTLTADSVVVCDLCVRREIKCTD